MLNLQFITHQTDRTSYLEGVRMALQGGCRWVQMRLKGTPRLSDPTPRQCAESILQMCREYGATFIIDDNVLLAQEVGADGVHLGRHDMPIREARQLLGSNFIIGGTANTFADIQRIAAEGADYIGCGPFRFTDTKKNLAPSLGLEGYQHLLTAMHEQDIRLPLIAIGGITLADIPSLLHIGVDGIAISGAILSAPNPIVATQQFLHIQHS